MDDFKLDELERNVWEDNETAENTTTSSTNNNNKSLESSLADDVVVPQPLNDVESPIHSAIVNTTSMDMDKSIDSIDENDIIGAKEDPAWDEDDVDPWKDPSAEPTIQPESVNEIPPTSIETFQESPATQSSQSLFGDNEEEEVFEDAREHRTTPVMDTISSENLEFNRPEIPVPAMMASVKPTSPTIEQPQTSIETQSVEEEDDEFDDFQSAEVLSTDPLERPTPSQQPPTTSPGPQPAAPMQTFFLPSLSEVLTDEQKMAFAALCFLTLHRMAYRYARYEFIDINALPGSEADIAARRRSSQKSSSVFSREKGTEIKSLLDASDDEIDEDMELKIKPAEKQPKPEAAPVHTQTHSIASLNLPYRRQPFGDELSNPERIEDVLYFGRTFDGNLALCYSLKYFQEWAFDVMDRLYEELQVSQEERLFIEQTVSLGLETKSLVNSLLPHPARARTLKDFREQDLGQPRLPQTSEDKRPYILWNLIWILSHIDTSIDSVAGTTGKYSARSRAFLRHLAVDLLESGTWCDVIEHVEVPITTAPTSKNVSESPLAGLPPSGSASSLASVAGTEAAAGTSSAEGEDKMMKNQQTSGRSMVLRNKEKEQRVAKDKRKRFLMMTAAAVSGGAIIGVSAGLAAPVVTAGLGAAMAALKIAGGASFLAGAGGTALFTSGAVIAGSGTAIKGMEKRTRGVEIFRFIPLQTNKDRANLIIYVAGWVFNKEGKGKSVPVYRRSPSVHGGTSSSTPDLPSGSSAQGSTTMTTTAVTPDQLRRQRAESRASATSGSTTVDDDEQEAEEILATGLEDLLIPFAGVSPIMGSQYSLCFDPHELATLGKSLKIFASELISFSTQQILQQTILSGVMSGLTWPLWLVKLGYLVDNPWSIGLDRAKKAGLILADSICNNVHNGRPVTLVGYSLGARVIFYALRELALRGKFDVVEDVFLFGTPVLVPHVNLTGIAATSKPGQSQTTSSSDPVVDPKSLNASSPNAIKSLDEWREALSVVNGRLYNCFSRSDWVLGFLFRAAHGGIFDVAGLCPVVLDDTETPDVVVLPGLPSQQRAASKAADPSQTAQELAAQEEAAMLELIRAQTRLHNSNRVIQNVDITAYVSGHINYRSAMPILLNKVCGFATWTEEVETLEQVVAGDWMDSIDGWWQDEAKQIKERRRRQKRRERSKSTSSNTKP